MYLLSSIAVQMTVISTINTSFSSHKKTSLCFQKEANNKNLLEVLLERELNSSLFLFYIIKYYSDKKQNAFSNFWESKRRLTTNKKTACMMVFTGAFEVARTCNCSNYCNYIISKGIY